MGIKKYPQLKRESVRDWKIKCQKNYESSEEVEFFTVTRQGCSSVVSDELVTEIKATLHNLRVSAGVISRKTVTAIGNEVLISRCSKILT